MPKLRTPIARAAALLAVAVVPAAAGAQVAGTAAAFAGSRTGALLDVGGQYQSAFDVSWSITEAGAGLLRYTYTFTGFGAPGISHLVIGLTGNCPTTLADNPCVSAPTVNGAAAADYEIGTFAAARSNPGIAGGIFGVKINTPGSVDAQSGATFSFLSNRTPVYGDFYAKGGRDSYAQNDGLLAGNRQSTDAALFVARPDGVPYTSTAVVPEPATLALTGTGLLGLAAAVRRRRNGQRPA